MTTHLGDITTMLGGYTIPVAREGVSYGNFRRAAIAFLINAISYSLMLEKQGTLIYRNGQCWYIIAYEFAKEYGRGKKVLRNTSGITILARLLHYLPLQRNKQHQATEEKAMIDWSKLNKDDTLTITEIVKRATKIECDVDTMSAHMDISAAHIACPMRLEDLLAAGTASFAHDVFGIMRHIDRQTGELGDCFRPRFAI